MIDGKATEQAWQQAKWHKLNHLILGEKPSNNDFNGRYKLLWDENYLYLLAEIQDDVLFDQHTDPLFNYWDDDCLEIFIDEDHSGGGHQFDFNAFAYHVALDNQVADIGPNKADGSVNFILLNDHVRNRWQRSAGSNKILWETAIAVYDKNFQLNSDNPEQYRVKLIKDKVLGFMLAYCDNDGSAERESFIGSHFIKPINGDKNLGYKTADVFGDIRLVE